MLIMSIRMLKARSEFLRIRGSKLVVRGHGFLLSALSRDDNDESIGIGFTITRKLGNAVIRNRLRRRLREVIKLLEPNLPTSLSGYDVVIVAHRISPTFSFSSILSDLESSFTDLSRKC